MTALPRHPNRYRRLPHTPADRERYNAEQRVLLERAHRLDAAQQALSVDLAEVRTQLAHLRTVMWPRAEPDDIVRGFRYTRVHGPAPIPPEASNALPVGGKHLRSVVLAILVRAARPMALVEIHRELHLCGYAIESRFPVKRLADALGYETRIGRARRVRRAVYTIDQLNPGTRRRIARRAAALQAGDDLGHELTGGSGVRRDAHPGGFECLHLRLGGPLRAGDDRAGVAHLLAGRRGHARDVATRPASTSSFE